MRPALTARTLHRWLPEILLLLAFGYFALRRLGSFPAAWADDSLFMLVAKMVAEGHGYVLPVLGYDWAHPPILAVGPTLIYPVALAIRFFGFSVAVARLPMVFFLLAATAVSYLYVQRAFDVTAARWNAALLVSLSAFINTGKPVLGEIPAFFFLMLGFLMMQQRKTSVLSAASVGVAFGLAVVSKLTFGLIFPALAVAWTVTIFRRDRKEITYLSIAGTAAAIITVAGAYWMGAFDHGFLEELRIFLWEKKSVVPLDRFQPIFLRPSELMRAAYGHYVIILVLAALGWRVVRPTMRGSASLTILPVLALLFTLYFLNGPGWYRSLLPATLLLLLFVPSGARTLLGKRGASALLAAIVIAQGYWQLTYRGASTSPEAPLAAQALEEQWNARDLVILPPEVFVRLSDNPHWLFLSEELREEGRRPPEIEQRLKETRCLPIFRKESHEDLERKKGTYLPVSGRYVVFQPPSDCPHR